MNPQLLEVDNLLTAKYAQIADLSAQLAVSKGTFILPALQIAPWELLWGVGRSTPMATDDHGQATFMPGEPAQIDFWPKTLASGESDNLYMVRRIGQYFPVSAIVGATRVTYSFDLGISNPLACQAFEWECQRQSGLKLWNMAWQLRPDNPVEWHLFAFDYSRREPDPWIPTGIIVDPLLLANRKLLSIGCGFSMTDSSESHDYITINGKKSAVSFTQPVFTAAKPGTYFNVAMQPDAKVMAQPYMITLGNVTVSLS
jgi:hypothetical protein